MSFNPPPTESSAGGTLIYVADYLACKPGTDLQIYRKRGNLLLLIYLILKRII